MLLGISFKVFITTLFQGQIVGMNKLSYIIFLCTNNEHPFKIMLNHGNWLLLAPLYRKWLIKFLVWYDRVGLRPTYILHFFVLELYYSYLHIYISETCVPTKRNVTTFDWTLIFCYLSVFFKFGMNSWSVQQEYSCIKTLLFIGKIHILTITK